MIVEENYNSNLINFGDLEPGECFRSQENDRLKTVCVYYIKLEAPIKQWGTTYTAIRVSDGAFWPFAAKDKVHKIKTKIVIEDIIR